MRYLRSNIPASKALIVRHEGRLVSRPVAQVAEVGDALHQGGQLAAEVAVAGRYAAVQAAREHQPRVLPDRRKFSRRIQSLKQMPIELRSGVERRHGSRRKGEPTMHIRVKV